MAQESLPNRTSHGEQPLFFAWVAGMFVFSGAAGLVYQVVWLKWLTLTFGNTVYATSTLLASFLGGLALGSYVFGRVSRRLTRPIEVYALLEMLIGLLALLSPFLFSLIDQVFILVYRGAGPQSAWFPVLRFVLSWSGLLLPTALMGGTLPVLCRAFVRADGQVGFRVGLLYAVNTAGAVVGCFTAGFFLIPYVGLQATLETGVVLNLFVAAGVLIAARFRGVAALPAPLSDASSAAAETGSFRTEAQDASAAERRRRQRSLVVFVFFLCGAASIAYEVLWARLLVLHLGSSVYTYSLMLTVVLLGLSLGGWIGGALAERASSRLLHVFALVEIAITVVVGVQLHQFADLSPVLANLAQMLKTDSYWGITRVSFLAAGQLLLPATVLIGIAFPLAVKAYVVHWDETAHGVGVLYGVNSLGAIAGSLGAGFLLVPWIGAERSLAVTGGVNALAGLILVAAAARGRFRKAAAAMAPVGAAAAVLLLWLARPRADLIESAGVFQSEEVSGILAVREDATATVTVEEKLEPSRNGRDPGERYLSLSVNGVNVAGTSPDLVAVQKLQGHLPLLLHGRAETVLHIGFGSGGTAWAVSRHPVRSIVIAEMSPAIVDLADQYFRSVNHGVVLDPRVAIEYTDGRNLVLADPRTFDVILSDSIHPKYAGNGSLYTADYYRMCRTRLNPGGVVSQWLPLYSLTPEGFRMILRAFIETFPRTTVWYHASVINPFTVVVGSDDARALDWDRVAAGFRHPEVARDLAEIGIRGPEDVFADFVAGWGGVRRWTSGVEPHFDDLPVIEYMTMRAQTPDFRERTWASNFADVLKFREPLAAYLARAPDESTMKSVEARREGALRAMREQLAMLVDSLQKPPARLRLADP